MEGSVFRVIDDSLSTETEINLLFVINEFS